MALQTLPLGARLWIGPAPKTTNGVILICPGGGYQWLAPREGEPVARAFTAGGWQAAVLYYTVRETPAQPPLGNLPLRQLREAVAYLRGRFPGQVMAGCGFSAGAHLVASLGVDNTPGTPKPNELDALILCYPVITAGPFAHGASLRNLAGEGDAAPWSLETRVTSRTPPTFLWHTVDDPEVPVENTLLMAGALRRAGVPFELHLFPHGAHGLSLATPEVDEPAKGRLADPHVADWLRLCLAWLATLNVKETLQ